MNAKVSVLFYARKSKAKSSSKIPIYMRITVDGQRAEFSTGKVFAKGGLNLTESSIETDRSYCFFHETKLQKKCEVEKQARLNATDFSIKVSTPPFANTMCLLHNSNIQKLDQ